jgi:hypothetical protein
MKQIIILIVTSIVSISFVQTSFAGGHDIYGPWPVTVKGYSGDKTDSTSYSGQIARHAIHDSLKSLASKGDAAEMMAYFNGSDKNKAIISPSSKDEFVFKQTLMDDLSKGKNLSGKTYKGIINGWPGGMTGPEVIEFMIEKAALSPKGFDASTGYNYPQLISKFAMGAVFYNQAVDNYLDEKLDPDVKPNNKPYKDGAYYTGKEHVWDEAWGYWGAAAHTLRLTAEQSYNVAKKKDMKLADFNGDGVVDMKSEYTFAHAYYAASFDKGGKTNYLETITKAFIHGREIIASANGRNLNFDERTKLLAHRDTILDNWEKVIAESVFKYAGSVYKDMSKLEDDNSEKNFSNYAKHWGELKGFALALQCGKNNLGETAVKLNRMMGHGPVLMNASQVVGVDSEGNYIKDQAQEWDDYKLHMLKIQKLMIDQFGVKAKSNDQLANMSDLAAKLGSSDSAEND